MNTKRVSRIDAVTILEQLVKAGLDEDGIAELTLELEKTRDEIQRLQAVLARKEEMIKKLQAELVESRQGHL